MKKILVTGGAGFIGQHLCRKLLDMGNEVYCLDNFSTGSKENINDFSNDNKFWCFNNDITEPSLLYPLVACDQIYHLACPASPAAYKKDPVHTMMTCVAGSKFILDFAKKDGAKILLTSTSEVYGDPLVHPQQEDYFGNVNSLGPRSCYDNGKRAAETLFMDYHFTRGVDTRIARIFNTYGPGMLKDDGRVISNFIVAALQNKDLIINGKGSQTRSFCYVDDMVDGLISLMETPLCLYPVNLGNPEEYSILDLANEIISMIPGCNSKINYSLAEQDDPKRRRPDIARATELLNWSPTTSLNDGLDKTIKYFATKLYRGSLAEKYGQLLSAESSQSGGMA